MRIRSIKSRQDHVNEISEKRNSLQKLEGYRSRNGELTNVYQTDANNSVVSASAIKPARQL